MSSPLNSILNASLMGKVEVSVWVRTRLRPLGQVSPVIRGIRFRVRLAVGLGLV
jgi:hypothetical protein